MVLFPLGLKVEGNRQGIIEHKEFFSIEQAISNAAKSTILNGINY
jgi:hypothetical protein